MKIDRNELNTLWYENENGEKWIPDFNDEFFYEAPKGFIYQVSGFPNELKEKYLKLTQKEEVESCPHPEKYVVPTDGWIDGVKGRECKMCFGSQVVKEGEYPGDGWPEEWMAEGAREIMTFTSSWPEDLVGEMYKSGDYTLTESILICAKSCERCLNVLFHKYLGDAEGYPEGSEEWKKTNTSCKFCEE